MDELGILDMDELDIQHSELEFHPEHDENKKNGSSDKEVNSSEKNGMEKKKKRTKNGAEENVKPPDKGAVVYNIDLMESFQTIKNVDRSNGK